MLYTIPAYVGSVLALVVLWRASSEPFATLKWYLVLSVAIAGAVVGAIPSEYQVAGRLAELEGGALDMASLLGAVIGHGIGTGVFVGLIAVIGNVLQRRRTSSD